MVDFEYHKMRLVNATKQAKEDEAKNNAQDRHPKKSVIHLLLNLKCFKKYISGRIFFGNPSYVTPDFTPFIIEIVVIFPSKNIPFLLNNPIS